MEKGVWEETKTLSDAFGDDIDYYSQDKTRLHGWIRPPMTRLNGRPKWSATVMSRTETNNVALMDTKEEAMAWVEVLTRLEGV